MSYNQNMNVNPSLLVWARKESGFGVEKIARLLQVTEERVLTWEKGERPPTLKQAAQNSRDTILNSQTGMPVDSEDFILRLGTLTGRTLKRQEPGPKARMQN